MFRAMRFAMGLWLPYVSAIAPLAHGGETADRPPAHRMHASLVAYPNAVISIAAAGRVFYVEGDGRTVVAISPEGAIQWRSEVLDQEALKALAKGMVIRHLRMEGGQLMVTFGKSGAAKVDPKSGKVEFAGTD